MLACRLYSSPMQIYPLVQATHAIVLESSASGCQYEQRCLGPLQQQRKVSWFLSLWHPIPRGSTATRARVPFTEGVRGMATTAIQRQYTN